MHTQTQALLAPYTSLGVGGPAETLITIQHSDEIAALMQSDPFAPITPLGYGANVVISDAGVPGITLLMRNTGVTREGLTVIAESGTWWDEVVEYAISENLWGLELMSAIPGSVGAAVVGNIAAYGQAVSDSLVWVEVFDCQSHEISRIAVDELALAYRTSRFQTPEYAQLIILRAGFTLHAGPQKPIGYQSIIDSGEDLTTLAGRRNATLIAREHSGSIWDYHSPEKYDKTVGSFFRNPLVTAAQAEHIISFDETGKTAAAIQKMNQVHGGDSKRVSAAHVLLAAGYHRGQSWGPVKLHDQNLLKLQNTGNATASQINTVTQEIIATVKQKLEIELLPEARFLGQF